MIFSFILFYFLCMNLNMHDSLTAENLTPSICNSLIQDSWADNDDTDSQWVLHLGWWFIAIVVFLPLVAQKSRIVTSLIFWSTISKGSCLYNPWRIAMGKKKKKRPPNNHNVAFKLKLRENKMKLFFFFLNE